jgi:uncharacterized protein (TIGR02757 family)
MKAALDRLYAGFNHPDAALDPVQIVRRYAHVADREAIAFFAAGLAFGRVASVMASVEAACRVLGPAPAARLRAFDPRTDAEAWRGFVHRWTTAADMVALCWTLRQMLERHGSLEQALAAHLGPADRDVQQALEGFGEEARHVDLRPAYGRQPRRPGVWYFFSRPSSGAACKRLNLFLRWMTRRDAVDPGGWTRLSPRRLVVPLDTHTIRVGRCLGLTRRASPGWKMASEITAGLRVFDPDDPVRYDFALCHLSMMGACGWQSARGNGQCPLRGLCQPGGQRCRESMPRR